MGSFEMAKQPPLMLSRVRRDPAAKLGGRSPQTTSPFLPILIEKRKCLFN